MKKLKVLYINRAGIPNNAPGIRIYNVAKVFRELGHEVLFYCDKPDYVKDTVIEYDGFKYYYATNYKSSKYSVLSNVHELIFASQSIKKIERLIDDFNPDIVILYNDIYSITNKLIKYHKNNNFKLIADVTEWYGKRKSKKIGDKIVPFLTNLRIQRLDKKVRNIISITSYLENFYITKNCNTMLLPPVFDVEDIEIKKYNYYNFNVINMVYAGVPGNKDTLNPILTAIEAINCKGLKIRIDLVGIDENYLEYTWKKSSFKNNGIFAHGRLPHDLTLEIVKKADFGILFRNNERYAKAGFSTKFSECMSNGVAMICNSVGGADLIIDNMKDGIVIDNLSNITIEETLNYIYQMEYHDLLNMRMNAYVKAKELFDRKNYIKKFSDFLDSLR